jgi:hypothetical protein
MQFSPPVPRSLMLFALCGVAFLACVSSASGAATLGVMFTGSDGPTESVEEWKVIGKSGAGFFRTPVSPNHSANGNDWTYYDRVFSRAAENGVRILPILGGRLDSGNGLPSAGEQAAWSEWAKKAVRRYGYNGVFWSTNPGITALPVVAWEMGNEPNNSAFGTISATAYGEFLAWAGPAVQSTSESWGGQKTGVLFGGLLSSSGGTNYQTYLKNAYNVPGASSAITGVAFHPYTVAIVDNQEKINVTKNTILGARNYINGLTGGGNKSLWITEFGWPSRGEYAVTEEAQANMLLQTVGWMRAEATNLNLRSIVWYNLRDSDFTGGWQYRCGLRDEVGNFRPAWFAFQQEAGAARWPVPRVAFHEQNTGNAWVYSKSGGAVNTLLGMAPGTSPSIGQFAGSHEVAIRANTGTLWTWTPAEGGKNTNLAMEGGTSPSITPLEGGRIAFHGSNGNLWTYDSRTGAAVDTGWLMAAGTSPSISVLPELYWRKPARYVIAWQGPGGGLEFTHGDGSKVNSGYGMASGTSPVITAQDSGASDFAMHFQANTGQMWIYEPGGTVATTGLGMKTKTNPGMASLPSGKYTAPFQANTGSLWLYTPGGTVANTGYGMQPESSPAVVGFGDAPFYTRTLIAFIANSGKLWTYEGGGAVTDTGLASKAATSPAVSPG